MFHGKTSIDSNGIPMIYSYEIYIIKSVSMIHILFSHNILFIHEIPYDPHIITPCYDPPTVQAKSAAHVFQAWSRSGNGFRHAHVEGFRSELSGVFCLGCNLRNWKYHGNIMG